MGFVTANCSRYKLLGTLTCATILCLAIVSLVDRWTPQRLPQIEPAHLNELYKESSVQEQKNLDKLWKNEYESRVRRVRDVCERNEIAATRHARRVSSNRRFGMEAYCKPRICPIIVDEEKGLFFCFIPKVASTLFKQYFLNVSDIAINDTVQQTSTAFHLAANNQLKRISPMYYPSTTAPRFFKIIFVRHPFDRLVSAFRSKAEQPREEFKYFYDRFWDPVMKKLRPKGAPRDKLTFAEFVWYLTHSLERDFDDHWSPYWSRCNPCLVDYDFIGKIETAKHDFPYAFRKVGIELTSDWWETQPASRSLTVRYFSTVSEEAIRRLYHIYKLDFDLFGYSVHEFLPGNSTNA